MGKSKSYEQRMQEKKELTDAWKGKGVDWLVDKLWDARRANKENVVRWNERTADISSLVEKQNQNLAKILANNGIRPQQLTIIYRTRACNRCSSYDGEYCTDEYVIPEQCPWKTVVKTVSFYAFSVDDGYLKGINEKFETAGFEVVRVTERESGFVLYEEDDEEEE